MNISKLLLDELKREAESTRKLLDCVPEGKNDWRSHEKSYPLGRLASHIAEMPQWIGWIVNAPEFDMSTATIERKIFDNHKDLMEYFDTKLQEGIAALENVSDEILEEQWTFRAGDHIIMQSSRYNALRYMGFSHLVHHRAQLGVYLRLLEIPIPGVYGPSSDDRAKMAANA